MHAPERAEHVLIGLGTRCRIVDETDQRREAERAGHQDGLVVRLIAVFADRNNVIRGSLEFLLSQPDLAYELMQVAYERGHDLAEPGIGSAFQFGENRGRDVLLVFDDHQLPHYWLGSPPRKPAIFQPLASLT